MNPLKTAIRAALLAGVLSSVGALAATPVYNVTDIATPAPPNSPIPGCVGAANCAFTGTGGPGTFFNQASSGFVGGNHQGYGLNDYGNVVSETVGYETFAQDPSTMTAGYYNSSNFYPGYQYNGVAYHPNSYGVTGANGVGLTSLGTTTVVDFSGYGVSETGTGPLGTMHSYAQNGNATLDYGTSLGFAGINNLGQIAGTSYGAGGNYLIDVGSQSGQSSLLVNGGGTYRQTGAVRNADGSVTYYGEGTSLAAINNNGAVIGTSASGTAFYAPAGTTAEQSINGGNTTAVTALNDNAQITGGAITAASTMTVANGGYYVANSTGTGYTLVTTSASVNFGQAFLTAANNGAVSLINLAGAQASEGLAVNNLGQVGGYLEYINPGNSTTTYSTTNRAFLTTAHGALTVGLGVGAATDNTETLYVNNLGEAIVLDQSTGEYYLYAGGSTYAVNSLVSPGTLPTYYSINGFNNLGQILVNNIGFDSMGLPIPNVGQLLTLNPSASLTGGVAISTTADYAATMAAQGFATTSTAQSATAPMSRIQSYTVSGPAPVIASAASGSSVPAPASWGLLGLGVAGLLLAQRKRQLVA